MKLMRIVAIGLMALIANQMLAVLAPSEFLKLQGLRFRLEKVAKPATARVESPTGKKAQIIPDLLADGSELRDNSPERTTLAELGIPFGDAPYVSDWQKSFSPLMGALTWHNGIIHNLYFYGPQDDPLIKFVQFVFHAPPNSHELSVTQYDQDAIRALFGLSIFGTVTRGALIRPSKGVDWGKLRSTLKANLEGQLSEQLKQLEGERREYLPAAILDLGEQIANARKSTIFPKYFIGLVLSAAWYWLAQGKDLGDEVKNGAVIHTDPSTTGEENKAITALTAMFDRPYPPLILQSWKMSCAFDKRQKYPDCGENTLHNLFDFLIFDPSNREKYDFDKYLTVNGIKPRTELANFYRENPLVSASNKEDVCQKWADLVSGVPGVEYGLIGKCDISPSSDMVLKIVRYLLNVPEEKLAKWDALASLLSTSAHTIAVKIDSETQVTIFVKDPGFERSIILHMNPGHAEADFPTGDAAISNELKTEITTPVVRLLLNLDPLTTDLALAQAQIYAQPMSGMFRFDKVVSTFIDNCLRDPAAVKYARHWFIAAGTKWLELPDNTPIEIFNIAAHQLAVDGPLKKEAADFFTFIGARPQLHKAYAIALLQNTADKTLSAFEGEFNKVLAMAKDAKIDLSPIFLRFATRGAERARAFELAKKEIGDAPQNLPAFVNKILSDQDLLESNIGKKAVIPFLETVIPTMPVSAPLVNALVKNADLELSIQWLTEHAKQIAELVPGKQLDEQKWLNFFANAKLNPDPIVPNPILTQDQATALQPVLEAWFASDEATKFLPELYKLVALYSEIKTFSAAVETGVEERIKSGNIPPEDIFPALIHVALHAKNEQRSNFAVTKIKQYAAQGQQQKDALLTMMQHELEERMRFTLTLNKAAISTLVDSIGISPRLVRALVKAAIEHPSFRDIICDLITEKRDLIDNSEPLLTALLGPIKIAASNDRERRPEPADSYMPVVNKIILPMEPSPTLVSFFEFMKTRALDINMKKIAAKWLKDAGEAVA